MKKNSKRKYIYIIFVIIIGISVYFLSSCSNKEDSKNREDTKKSDVVRVLSFGDYIDPKLIDRFEKKTGIKVVMDTFDTNEELYPVIDKGTVKYDVITASDYMIDKLNKKNLLAKLDYKNIPNKKNMDENYMKLASLCDKNNEHSVPHTFGTMGIMYNTKKIAKGEITSWKDLWKDKYYRQIVMPDSLRELLGIGLKLNGYSLNSTNTKELSKAVKSLRNQKPLVYKYANDSARDMVIGGYTDIAIVWSGEVMYSKEENPDLEYVIPKEGTEEFMDLWAIPKNAEHKSNGEKWINFMLDKKVALTNYEYLTYAIPNKAVIAEVSKDKYYKNILFPSENLLKKCEFLKSSNHKDDEIYSKYWKKFKT